MDEATASVAAEQQLLAELDADSSCKVMKATKKAKKQSKARKVKQLEQTLERDASAVDDEVTQQLCADMLGAPCANFPTLTYDSNTSSATGVGLLKPVRSQGQFEASDQT